MKLTAPNFRLGNQPTADEEAPLIEAEAALKRAHLAIPQRPLDDRQQDLNPKLTSDLAATSSDKLGRLLTQFTAICDFVAYQTALAEIDSTAADQGLEYVSARVRLEKTGTVQEKADKTSIDPRVRSMTKESLEKGATYTLMTTLLKNYERDLSAVSREITRRGNEWERNK